ncbi:hypothetical protein IWW36_004783 [Coemansia brasiliensis]|uniref:Major facilitator superfamily (MFS) profile domain-containing protein n=1 Tax=Coemansia brasiliensis TaxID=2650707 RepID=A0A9W8LYG3_9FUNG|nr:hypothetical protein IWW36_004783 [Coemansia brasiliensis]
MVAYIGGVLGEGTSTTIWVNVLPTKLEGRMDPSVDIFSAINNITYFFELPKDQRVIVQDGYVKTQKILTICGICSMLIAGIAMLGLAPYDLSAKTEEEEEQSDDSEATTKPNATSKLAKLFGKDQSIPKITKVLVVVGLFFINFVTALAISSLAAILPRVLSDFNAMTKIGAINIAQYLLSACVRPVFAKVSFAFGALHALVLSILLHTLGTFVCALGNSFGAVFAGTVMLGLAHAGFGTLVAIIVADILPLYLRASVTAYVSVPFVANYYLGVVVADRLYNQWHWVYGILCILGVACSLPALFSMVRLYKNTTSSTDNKPPLAKQLLLAALELDLAGLLMLSSGLAATLAPLGLQLNSKYGWKSAAVIAPIVSGSVVLCMFIIYELYKAPFPVVPLRLLKVRTFACAILAALLFFFTFNVSLFFFTPFIQVTRNVSAQTAMWLQQGTTGYYIGLFAGGWAMQKSKRYRRWAWLGWCLCLLAICLMLRSKSGAGNAEVAIVQAVLGIGGGIVVGCSGIGIQASVAEPDLPMAITLYSMVEYVGGVLGEAVSTSIWVNILPTKLYLDPSIDIQQVINNITYYMAIPNDQQAIVQGGYIDTQRLLTICGICSMSLAAVAILGLAPHSLNTTD